MKRTPQLRRLGTEIAAYIGTDCRLYWYRGRLYWHRLLPLFGTDCRLYWYRGRLCLCWYRGRLYWYRLLPKLVQSPPLLVQIAASVGTEAASIGTDCRLYWYRGVTVLLPGWVIWKYWNCPCKFFSLGSWLVFALSTPIPLLT
jgi:hypothetical protein